MQPAAPAATRRRWHPLRRLAQVLCGVLLVALPLTNGLRLDVRRDVFYFAWHRMAAHDLLLLFWCAMLGVWGLVAVSLLYGRVWCGWVCPQTLASDFADSLRVRLDRALGARRGRGRRWLARGAWAGLLGAMSVGTGMVLASYWLAPGTVGRATLHPWGDWPAAAVVYGLAAVLAADMLWVRRRFCSHACPYGALMGLLADKNTLAVRYLEERSEDCIRCGQCEVKCPMGIDIKRGAGQMECIGCGECVDACQDVLGKRGVAGLIEFRYGLSPERHTGALTGAQRLGLWDGTRWAVVATLFVFAGIVGWQMVGRAPLAASVLANGGIVREGQVVRNGYTLSLSNGTPGTQTYALQVDGLPPGARVVPSFVTVAGRDSASVPVTVWAPSALLGAHRRVRIGLSARAGRQGAWVRTIFYAP